MSPRNAVVTRAFVGSRRREALSFAHHEVVASLPEAEQDDLLDWCVRGNDRPRSREELREEKRHRDYEKNKIVFSRPRMQEEIDARKAKTLADEARLRATIAADRAFFPSLRWVQPPAAIPLRRPPSTTVKPEGRSLKISRRLSPSRQPERIFHSTTSPLPKPRSPNSTSMRRSRSSSTGSTAKMLRLNRRFASGSAWGCAGANTPAKAAKLAQVA